MKEPFSRPLVAAHIPTAGKRLQIEADAAERQGLSALLGIPGVTSLVADLEVRPGAGEIYRVRGSLEASVVQTDVVTLEPVSQEASGSFEVSLVPSGSPAAGSSGESGEADDTAPDVFENGLIDLGAIVREQLALALDPYPRAPGVEFAGHIEDDPAADPSPFAVLSALKR